jgi:putative proteasome-type protease
MSYQGLVLASDSRSNSGFDQVSVCRKMHTFVLPGERVFVLVSSGSLSVTQSVITQLRIDFERGDGLAKAESMYRAARVVGDTIRRVADIDRAALERDKIPFNVNIILGGQIKGEQSNLYLIYPQGNPLRATKDSPYLQIGEVKYGRPILDRGLDFNNTTLDQAAKYAVLSLDSTMRSNVTVGPPIDLLLYYEDELIIRQHRRLKENDPDLLEIHAGWETSLRKIVSDMPSIRFGTDITGE